MAAVSNQKEEAMIYEIDSLPVVVANRLRRFPEKKRRGLIGYIVVAEVRGTLEYWRESSWAAEEFGDSGEQTKFEPFYDEEHRGYPEVFASLTMARARARTVSGARVVLWEHPEAFWAD